MEHYGENQSVFSCTMPDYFDTEPYLRLKSLTLRADQLDRYLTARVSENKSYQDATTGNTFLSLSKQIQNVIHYEIPRIQAYILRGGLSADVSSLTAMLQYKLQIEQLDYQEQMAYYNSDNLGIGLYDESMSAIVMIPTLDENREFYMSRTKVGIDDLALRANELLSSAVDAQKTITTNNSKITALEQPTEAQELQVAQSMVDVITQQLASIVSATRELDADCYAQRISRYLVFNGPESSFIKRYNIKPSVMLAALIAPCGIWLLSSRRSASGSVNACRQKTNDIRLFDRMEEE